MPAMSKKKIAVVLAGCGYLDGSEIQEAVLSLLAIDEADAEAICFAPDIDQMHVVDHLKGEPVEGTRNVLTESARIARGAVQPLSEFDASAVDALLLPGGFGAAKNLSSFAIEGADCSVQADVEKAVLAAHKAGLPIGALCVAPAILAKLLPETKLTLGAAGDAANAAEAMGASHQVTTHGEIVIDSAKKIVTSPCYMLDASVKQIAEGARKTVGEILNLAGGAA